MTGYCLCLVGKNRKLILWEIVEINDNLFRLFSLDKDKNATIQTTKSFR